MSGEQSIEVRGRVIEALSHRLFRVELPNGHRLLAHTSGRVRLQLVKISLGDLVTVRMSPYDLSTGAITVNEK